MNLFMEEFSFLAYEQNVGIYNKCEIIEIFGIANKNECFNIYTLVSFEHSQRSIIIEDEFLLPKPQKLSKNICVGIKKRIVNIDVAEHFYRNLGNGSFKVKNNDIILPQ